MASPAPRFRQVFILGVPRCGSTLLGRDLHSHPLMACVGELALLGDDIAAGNHCGCGEPVTACPFWNPLLPVIDPVGRFNYRKFSPATYERLRQQLGAEVIVDTSKVLAWRMFHRPFSPWRRAESGYILMVRDARGVIGSYLRSGRRLKDVLNKYVKWMKRQIRHTEELPDRSLVIYYEELCAEPQRVLGGICDWIGLPFSEAMLEPLERKNHLIHSSVSEYTKTVRKIKLDERWRETLDAASRIEIEAAMRDIPLLKQHYLDQEPA
jgi:hypothetical protein